MSSLWHKASEPVGQILNRPATEASLTDILQLDYRRVLQLFHAAPCPDMAELDGEYRAVTHPAGPWALPARLFLRHWFGPGRWTGKAFQARTSASGCGYNLFAGPATAKAPSLIRSRKLETRLAPSSFDGRGSLHLDYRADNRGLFALMHDELRVINNQLFLGLGYLRLPVGHRFSAAFVIYGPPTPWVGC